MQPTQIANPGLAAYKPPPGIVNPLTARAYEQTVVSVATEPPMPDIAHETVGRTLQSVNTSATIASTPSRPAAVVPSPAPDVAVAPSLSKQGKKEPEARAAARRSDYTRTRQTPSQTASTRGYASRAFVGPYRGYAGIY